MRENSENWALTAGQIFLIPKNDAATVKAVSTDAKAMSLPVFEPMDPSVPMKIEANEIARRTDDL